MSITRYYKFCLYINFTKQLTNNEALQAMFEQPSDKTMNVEQVNDKCYHQS